MKNRQLLGSYYQDSKYGGDFKPSRAYKTYVKDIKSEWNRNPNNVVTKNARDLLLYRSTKLNS